MIPPVEKKFCSTLQIDYVGNGGQKSEKL